MADFATHHVFGFEVFKNASEPARSIILKNPTAYYYGLHGPDPLLYHNILKGGSYYNKLSSKLHSEKNQEFFEFMWDWAEKSSHSEICKSYLLGFTAHYCLDRRIHPLVYWMEGEIVKRDITPNYTAAHALIECQLDKLFHKRVMGTDVFTFSVSKLYPIRPELFQLFSDMIRDAFINVYGITDVSSEPILSSFKTMSHIARRLYSSRGITYTLCKGLDKALKQNGILLYHFKKVSAQYDFANTKKAKWENLETGEVSNDSAYNIFDIAKIECVQMTQQILAKGAYSIDYSISFDNGRNR